MVMILAFSAETGLLAQQAKPSEYQVKAAYLYNFGRFVKWPAGLAAGKGDSFPVCVLGRDPFGPILDRTLAGEALEGKPVVIRRILKSQDAADCRILFVSLTEENHLKEILAATDQAGVLTVSDIPGFSRRGGIIQFVAEGDRVRFEINLASAESAKLVMSSELLKVAAAVRRNARSGD
ncbi:MAG TPA: YfiR family protein [Acidobacteriota bacterium]|nr:YfiR family protein [Acidobacteriota bacterium]